ncbi:hypothetical protein V8F20_008284 [Naviculisporaceae sp. PSN 640]
MHSGLKTLWKVGYWLGHIPLIFIGTPLLAFVALLYIIITLPYTLLFYSAHWGLRHKYHSAVETYLAYFERLHPDLMAYVAACHTARAELNVHPMGVRRWPHRKKRTMICIPFVGSLTTTEWSFSTAAGLFAKLEAHGWRRRLVWTFLRDQVEQTGWPTQEERESFARAMKVRNSHCIWPEAGFLQRWFCFAGDSNGADAEKERAAEERLASVGLPIVHVRNDSLDWLLQRGVLLVPNDETRASMRQLVTFAPIWGRLPKGEDLEKSALSGTWQVVDARDVYPWTDK